jgi:hypothetical protein
MKNTATAAQLAARLLMEDPETHEPLFPSSDITDVGDGSFQFTVENATGTRKWKHTIRTEEI